MCARNRSGGVFVLERVPVNRRGWLREERINQRAVASLPPRPGPVGTGRIKSSGCSRGGGTAGALVWAQFPLHRTECCWRLSVSRSDVFFSVRIRFLFFPPSCQLWDFLKTLEGEIRRLWNTVAVCAARASVQGQVETLQICHRLSGCFRDKLDPTNKKCWFCWVELLENHEATWSWLFFKSPRKHKSFWGRMRAWPLH